jgi:hypothetical protein
MGKLEAGSDRKAALFGGATNWKSSMFWPHRHFLVGLLSIASV